MITEYITQLEKEAESIERQINDVVYFMPGVLWSDAWTASSQQRERFIDLINKRLKEKSGNDDLI